jgi:SNF2 family DNA or RNA helicase
VPVTSPCVMQPLAADAEASPEKKGKRKATRSGGSKAAPKRAKGTTISPTAAMLPLIQGELRQYQLKGVTWLISLWTNGMNGILADQMGLGKTVQTIGFLSHLRANGINGPFLIVVPLSTLSNWKNEVARWCPSMSALVYHGDKKERQEMERKWLTEKHSSAPLHRPLCTHLHPRARLCMFCSRRGMRQEPPAAPLPSEGPPPRCCRGAFWA